MDGQVMNDRLGHNMAAYEQPMNQATPYGGVGYGLSGVGAMGPMQGISMMGTPMGGGMYGMRGMGGMGMGGMAHSGRGGMVGGLQPYDSSKMKQGRMGHYGYLEGRELAGPPPGHMPAGMPHGSHRHDPPRSDSTYAPTSSQSRTKPSTSDYVSPNAPVSSGYYSSPTEYSPDMHRTHGQPHTQSKVALGDPGHTPYPVHAPFPGHTPRARYDGGEPVFYTRVL
ncbi:MAG: hypothetical protein TREMPRED_004145 [Tremellales sp. Tagirdzhanova-0007]|nr:MAG: hypothetical protein TREMPRED_004145 [Tremellales sp. Tagirdzhanova-0007]